MRINYNFTAELNGERILKTGRQLAKLCAEVLWHLSDSVVTGPVFLATCIF